MAAIWKGLIRFGLINVPVGLYSATESENDVSFKQLDGRDLAAIKYRKTNEVTGEEVEADDIVKGYEYSKGQYVIVSDDEIKGATAEQSKTVDLEGFIGEDEIEPSYFDKPYWLVPDKGGAKAYYLLHDVMAKSKRVAIGRVTLRSREYVAAVFARDGGLIMTTLRYHADVRTSGKYELGGSATEHGVTAAELKMAEKLVGDMAIKWNPTQYTDRYAANVKTIIEAKIADGQIKGVPRGPRDGRTDARKQAQSGDIFGMLKASIDAAEKAEKKEKTPRKSKRAAV